MSATKAIITLTVRVPDGADPSEEWIQQRLTGIRDALQPTRWHGWRGVDGGWYAEAQLGEAHEEATYERQPEPHRDSRDPRDSRDH